MSVRAIAEKRSNVYVTELLPTQPKPKKPSSYDQPNLSETYLAAAITIRNRVRPERKINASIRVAFFHWPQDYSGRNDLERAHFVRLKNN